MASADPSATEARALRVGTLGNAFGALSALVFFMHSGSDALMLDGLFTAVMAGASVIASRVSQAAQKPRSRAYPFSASGQESLYVLFRTLVLLGIIAFALVSAACKVLTHLQDAVLPSVRLDGLGRYFSAMVLLNLALWQVFMRAWSSSGRNSAMLRGMAVSAQFDALILAGTGIALLGAPLLLNTVLSPLVPIVDALLVLVLSVVLLPEPLKILVGAVAEAAGSSRSIPAAMQMSNRTAIAALPQQHECDLLELAMIRMGRTFTAVAYVNPIDAISAAKVDGLRLHVQAQLVTTLRTPVLCEVIPTAVHPYADILRDLPTGDHP